MTTVLQSEQTLYAALMTITPAMAEEWLLANTDNFRKVSEYRVAMYAADMAAGKWHVNGETITFHLGTGRLLNGQHRLHAVIKSGATIQSLVAWTYDNGGIDRGMGRTFSQVVTQRQVPNPSVAAASIRLICELAETRAIGRSTYARLFTDDRLIHFLESVDADVFAESVFRGRQMKSTAKVTAPIWSTLMYAFTLADAELAETFHERILTGSNMDPSGVLYVLHKRLMLSLSQTRGRVAARPSSAIISAWIIKSWNLVRAGKTCSVLKYFPESEPFPLIDGLDYGDLFPGRDL